MKHASMVFLTIVCFIVTQTFAQNAGDYRSKQSGYWNNTSTWQYYNGSTWIDATSIPSYTDGTITIRTGHTVTVSDARTIDQTIVEANATLVIWNVITINDGDESDLVINGSLSVANNGTLSGGGSVVINGTLQFDYGTISCTDITISNTGAMTIASNGSKTFNGCVIKNYGTITHTVGSITCSNSPSLYNYGVYDFQNTSSNVSVGTSGNGTFYNSGTLKKTVLAGFNTSGAIYMVIQSTGTIDVQVGTISLGGGGEVSGTLNVASGYYLNFGAGTFSLGDGTTITGAGQVHVSSSTVNLTGTESGVTVESGASLNVTNGGTLGGSGKLTVNGTLGFDYGTISCTDITISNTGAMLIGTSSNKTFNGCVIKNYGTITHTAYVNITCSNSPTINNYGVYDFKNTSGSTIIGSSGSGTFYNSGTLKKTAGSYMSAIDMSIHSTGTIEAQVGTLSLGGGGTVSGTLSVASGCNINFGAGTFSLGDGTTITGAGQVHVSSSTVNLTGTESGVTVASGASLNVTNNGTLGGSGKLTVNGTLGFDYGTISCTDITISTTGAMTIASNGSKTFNGCVIKNYGTITHTAYVNITCSNSPTINNYGVYDFKNTSGNTIIGSSGSGTFYNSGTLKKTDGSSAMGAIDMVIQSTGTIEAQVGTLSLGGGGAVSGTLSVASGCNINFGAGTFSLDDGTTITGAGQVQVTSPSTTVNVVGTESGVTVESGASLNVTNNGTLGGSGKLTVNGTLGFDYGTISCTDITISNTGVMSIGGSGAKTFNGCVIKNYGTITHTAYVNITCSNSPTIYNYGVYDFKNTSGSTIIGSSGSGTFYNSGTLKKTAGSSTMGAIDMVIQSTGTIEAQVGTLSLGGGGAVSGTLSAANGCNVNFGAGSLYTVNNELTLTGGGIILIANNVMLLVENSGILNHNCTTFTIYNTGSLTVNGTLNCVTTNPITGAGSFALNAGGTLKVSNSNGIVSSGTNGAIQTSTRSFSNQASYGFIGTSAQVTGNGVPSTVRSFIISNSAGVTLSQPVTVNDTLFLVSGTLDNSTTTVTIANGATISRTEGTLSNAPTFAGSVNLVYTGNTAVSTGNEAPSQVKKLTVANSGGVTLSQGMTVTDTLLLINGTIENSTNNITLQSGVTIVREAGSLASAPSFNGIANLVYIGTNAITTGNEVPSQIGTLVQLNSAGITLGTDINVVNTLTLQSGDIDLNGKVITLGASAQLQETSGNTVKGATGKITTTRTFNAGDLSSGVNIAGLGAKVTTEAELGTTVIERMHSQAIGGGNSGISRIYRISPTNNDGLNATLEFYYDESELSGISESDLRLFQSTDGSDGSWILRGGTVNTDDNVVTLSGIDEFSYWTLGNGNNPLPVEITQCIASVVGNSVVLEWRTATEVNNYGFEIERRNVGFTEWEKIAFVQGAGTSNSPKEYSYTDANLPASRYEYRLKQIDLDGTFKYSQSVEVEVGNLPVEFALHQNYPNPFNPSTTIRYDIPDNFVKVGNFDKVHVSLKVYDVLGKEVATLVNAEQPAGSYEVQFDASKLASGVYFYRIQAGNYISVKKLLLMK